MQFIFDPKRDKTAKTGFFGQNKKMLLPSHCEAPTLCQKSDQSYERFSRSQPDVRTYGPTDGGDLIGPNHSAGDQKLVSIFTYE